jgi:hypothetical protein
VRLVLAPDDAAKREQDVAGVRRQRERLQGDLRRNEPAGGWIGHCA